VIDIHCHIVPGVDDGAQNAEEAGQMLQLARESNTKAMVATPHCDLRYQFDAEECRERLALLQEQHPSGPRLYLGCEVHLTPENIAAVQDKPSNFTSDGGDCILLELPDRMLPSMADPAISALLDSGLRVIIAHPERNPYIQHQMSYADRLVESGCYLQLTARSLSGGFGPAALSTANYILKRRISHFIASDAHGATARRPGLANVFDSIMRSFGEPVARTLLVDNPEATLSGSAIQPMPAAPGWLSSLFSRTSNAYRKPVLPQVP
jgi:protein-tyrosine phosphatase